MTLPVIQTSKKAAAVKRRSLPAPLLVRRASIYAIINSSNLKIYIGSSTRTHHRWNQHRHELETQSHGNRYLQRAYNLCPQAFQIELVEDLGEATKAKILEREQFWINFYRSDVPELGYNLCPKAESCAGLKHSPEYGAAVRKRQLGIPWSAGRKAAWKEIRRRTQPKGWRWSKQARLKHSLIHMGIKRSPESAEKAAAKMRGRRLPQKGRPVLQVTQAGELIKRHEAIAYAAKELGINECNIRHCCKHPTWTAGGFHWRRPDAK